MIVRLSYRLIALAATFLAMNGSVEAAGEASRAVARGAANLVEAGYVFPDRAHGAALALRQNADSGDYDGLDGTELAGRLTTDLASVLHDGHVRVLYLHQTSARPNPAVLRDPVDRDMSYGLAKVAHLSGDIGYVDLRFFATASPGSARVLDAAMETVSKSRAIILDLRNNMGGDPVTVARVISHVLPPNTSLNEFLDKSGKVLNATSTIALSTPTVVAPLYVLTSSKTISGGEECAYDLQAAKRATIVGEVTSGAANPAGPAAINAQFVIFIPQTRPRNAVTHENWEGTGVKPNVRVDGARALTTAYRLALNSELRGSQLSPRDRSSVKDLLASLPGNSELDIISSKAQAVTITSWPTEVAISPSLLMQYSGTYSVSPTSNIVVSVSDGLLFTRVGGQPAIPNYPESDSKFFSKIVDGEIAFTRNPATNAVTQLTLIQDGRAITAQRLPDVTEVSVSEVILSQYAGIYKMAPNVTFPATGVSEPREPVDFTMTVDSGRLVAKWGNLPSEALLADSPSTFVVRSANARIEFIRDLATHAVSQLVFRQDDHVRLGTKQP